MNPTLKEVLKDDLKKLIQPKFIYLIFNSRWVSPLVVVPKKNSKWWICLDYRELNKSIMNYYFPLPLIDRVLEILAGKKYFSFLDCFSGYNQIQIVPDNQYKTKPHSYAHGG